MDKSPFLVSLEPGFVIQCVFCKDKLGSTESNAIKALKEFVNEGWAYGKMVSTGEEGPLCLDCWTERNNPEHY